MTQPLFTEQDVSERWHIPRKTLAQWRWRGDGPTFVRLGRHVRYRASDLEAFLRDREGGSSDAA